VSARYPIYVPSAGRWDNCITPGALRADNVPFHLVVQPKEADQYAERFGRECILELPWNNDGRKDGLLRARNWIRDHAEASGAARHWQLDDNISGMWRRYKARKIRCDAGVALRVCEDLSDRYENVGISGLNYYMFALNRRKHPPFCLNVHVYSCTLVNHAMPCRWRLNYNDDTDLCLQALASGWCTILLNAFLCWKMTTMTMKGGNTNDLYLIDDGRLKMSRTLERAWPGVVRTSRRFGRPQHSVRGTWGSFDTPLRLRPGVDLEELARAGANEFGLELHEVKDGGIQNESLRALVGDKVKTRRRRARAGG
jgi:hypothetical protein